MPERRKLKRRYLMYYSRVFDRKDGRLLGYLSDITPEGAMLISEEPITPGIVYRLRMDLPEEDFNKAHMSFEAHCIWSKPDVHPQFYMSGFQLINIPGDDVQIIERMIQEYGFRD